MSESMGVTEERAMDSENRSALKKAEELRDRIVESLSPELRERYFRNRVAVMEYRRDPQVDAVYMSFGERRHFARSKKVADGIYLDIGKNRSVIGIEVLNASQRNLASDIESTVIGT